MGVNYNPNSVLDGLELSLDFASPKNYSYNVFPYPLNINTWLTVNSGVTNNCTVSSDSTQYSPVGGTPMKMVVTNLDPFIDTYNASKWNLASANIGETWTASVWVKANTSLTIETPVMFEGISTGGYSRVVSTGINVDTNWKKITTSITIANANTTNIKVRLDGNNTGGTGTIWWDGLQVEKSAYATDFNPKTNTNGNTVTETLSSSDFVFHGDGYWIHETGDNRKNYIRNSTMVGAVAGTPGTLPTYWLNPGLSGLTQTIVETGIESGISYIDIRIIGTSTSAVFYGISAEGTNIVAASPNSVWTSSMYTRLVAGTLTNITGIRNVLTNYNSAGTALVQYATAAFTPTFAALSTQKYSVSTTPTTFTDATTAFVRGYLQVEANSGVAIDITLRIGLPKLEYGTQTVGALTFDRTASSEQKYGGGVRRTMTGNLTASKFMYNNHTWEVWFRINDRNPGVYANTSIEGLSALMLYTGYHNGFYYDANVLNYAIWNGIAAPINACTWTVGNSGAQINQGLWYQIAVSRSGNVFTPYVNGLQLGTGSTSATSNTGIGVTDQLWMGKSQALAANAGLYLYYSKNTIGAVKMYTKALSASEIKQNFNALRGRYGI